MNFLFTFGLSNPIPGNGERHYHVLNINQGEPIMNFSTLKSSVAKQFERLSKHQLFRTKVSGDDLWAKYLESFPLGSNPIYKTRTEHDCSCCKQFIRAVGNVVAIIDGKLVSIWDTEVPSEPNYQVVIDAMSDLVKSQEIDNVFTHFERVAGHDKNFQELLDGTIKPWEHFFVNIPVQYIMPAPGSYLGDIRATHDVMLRGLTEITTEAVDTVLELIDQNSLYRGEEHKFAVTEFSKLKAKFSTLSDEDRDIFVWSNVKALSPAVSRIRNTSIGTLLTELSGDMELEDAVKRFEAMVAPTNYKRPTALVTKAMVESARQKVEELGLTSALERRYATINDITINNILFANRSASKALTGNVFDELGTSVVKPIKSLDKIEEVPIDKFLSDILPKAESIELMVENRHASNFVSLVAPVDPTAKPLFKWDNGFSWSYNGEIADSDIRQAVKARGGAVDGVFRFSHSWNHNKRNASLMDLHVFMPGSPIKAGNCINDEYGNFQRVGWNNRTHSASGGVQDVDYTKPAPEGHIPVENITFPQLGKMPEGTYVCKVHNWNLRSPTQGGFKAEIEFEGTVYQYDYDKPLKHKEWVTVAEVTLKNGRFTIKHHLPVGESGKQIWGVNTHTFVPVNVLMMSPNYWDGHGVGNKHYFFMLDGCLNEGKARGFFNEFLIEELTPHRKVIEMVGSKMKTDESAEQLSGLGFSSTQRNNVLCKVKGAFSRIINVTF